MDDSLDFMMGEFRAQFPTDRLYAKNHMWAISQDDDVWRFGFTAYSIRLLRDVYFLEWSIEEGAPLSEKQEMGQIESQKAEASLYSPIAGTLERINSDLLTDPSAINVDGGGSGWLFEIKGPPAPLVTPVEYVDFLKEVWQVTQRMIKGQMNDSP